MENSADATAATPQTPTTHDGNGSADDDVGSIRGGDDARALAGDPDSFT
jgi:hypothetical protein